MSQYCHCHLPTPHKKIAQTFANAFKVYHKPQYNWLEPALYRKLSIYIVLLLTFRGGDSEGY